MSCGKARVLPERICIVLSQDGGVDFDRHETFGERGFGVRLPVRAQPAPRPQAGARTQAGLASHRADRRVGVLTQQRSRQRAAYRTPAPVCLPVRLQHAALLPPPDDCPLDAQAWSPGTGRTVALTPQGIWKDGFVALKQASLLLR